MRKNEKNIILVLVLALIVGILCGKYYYTFQSVKSNQVLYENSDMGIGFLIPKGYKENPFAIEENTMEHGVIINFLEPESKALVFSFYWVDKNYWNEEVKKNISVSYTEVYHDEDNVLLCINVSDVQYDVNNAKQCEKYNALWNLKDEICESLYLIEHEGHSLTGD